MKQITKYQCIWIVFLWMFCACSEDCKNDPEVGLAKIIESDLVSCFNGESITPYARKKGFLVFRTNDGGKFLVERRTKEITKAFPGTVLNGRHEKLTEELAGKLHMLDEFCINAILSEGTMTFVYTNFSDSSYHDLINADSTFRDINYRSNKNRRYNYVLVNIPFFDHNDKSKAKLSRLHSLKKISDRWYYYRSQYYSSNM